MTKIRDKNYYIVQAWRAIFDVVFIFLGLLILTFNGLPAIANLDSLNNHHWVIFCLGYVFFSRICERLEQLWKYPPSRRQLWYRRRKA